MKQIIPHLFVKNVGENVEFYKTKLGFEPIYVQTENEIVNFAILKDENAQIMIGEKEVLWKYFPQLKDKPESNQMMLYFEMTDVTAYFEKVKNSVEVIKELHDSWYKTREFWIKDCNGYLIAFYQNI
jgi:uncharacterized glyoxalase superfamily protein PhnB